MPQLLVIAHTWPEPTAWSAGRYMTQLLESFRGHGWRITVASAAATGPHKSALGVDELAISPGALPEGISAPDVVLFDHFLMEEQFAGPVAQRYPQALRMLAGNGLQSLREARQQLLRRRLVEGLDPNDFGALFATPGPDLFRQMAPAATTQREVAAIWRCDLTLLATQREIDLLVNGFGVADYLLHHCPPLAGPLHQPLPSFGERQHFVSFGHFGQAAYHDALLWMKHNLWPMLRRRLPDARLQLYGTGPAAKTMALHAPDEGFHVLGQAEDPQAAMASARVCLAPLRFGAGVVGELMDALRCGTPSVTTPVGAEGLQTHRPWPGGIATSTEELAAQAVRLHSDEAAWQQAQEACAPLLAARRDPVLLRRVEHALQHLEEQRLYNFTGAMLRRR
ncbi:MULTISPECIES: glycosyltransferase [unclassified Pseudomonas]|uniref:glycosyltransferase n=1 Tax=unclassified Pseudomonas TaxID=196821 RepID=UPI00244931F2|nr:MULTISPECIES: glycosyltransferase [unclassified Pseudomonas]MDH0300759.1 glycosyltransferase family 4 protein [Pseudomonas sp. GD04091]MDH1985029.1 glycosyltransferase family 4 protein [Pseudomonas sp. GD03689]